MIQKLRNYTIWGAKRLLCKWAFVHLFGDWPQTTFLRTKFRFMYPNRLKETQF